MTYFEKLKDPRWQKLRLQIMERAGFKCEICDDDKNTLNVHHGYYEKGLEPWEYDPETLHCLCEDCHESQQEIRKLIYKEIAKLKNIDELLDVSKYFHLLKVQNEMHREDVIDCDEMDLNRILLVCFIAGSGDLKVEIEKLFNEYQEKYMKGAE